MTDAAPPPEDAPDTPAEAAKKKRTRLQALAFRLLPGEPLISDDNLDSMRVPNVASPGALGLAELGIAAAALEAIVPQYLAPGFGDARFDRWRAQRCT